MMKAMSILSLIVLITSANIVNAQEEKFKAVIEFKNVPSARQLIDLTKKHNISLPTKFTKYPGEYFQKLYETNVNHRQFEQLKESSLVETIEAAGEAEGFAIVPSDKQVTSDPFSRYLWGLHNEGQTLYKDIDDIRSQKIDSVEGQDVDLKETLDTIDNKMKEEVLVAVIDSGVSSDHEDLSDNIYRNMAECDEQGRPVFRPKKDQDGNGYVGDCLGWDFTVARNNHRPLDDNGHGTHVSGIIAAIKGNGKGVSGLSNKIKILPIRVLKKREQVRPGAPSRPGGLSSFTDRIAKGLLYAITMKAKVVNLSLGWPKALDTKFLRETFKEAVSKGIILVAAAGNNSTDRPIFPCSYRAVICVGATTIDGSVASFSNFGGMVDFLAPGDQILSTVPAKFDPDYFSVQGYDVKNGTSQAAPYVSGAFAVLKGVFPEESNQRLLARLTSTAREVPQMGLANDGLIQLQKALNVSSTGAVVRPDLKELHTVIFKGADAEFEIKLPIKNIGDQVTSVSVEVVALGPALEMSTNKVSDIVLEGGEEKSLNFDGKVLDNTASSMVPFKFIIRYGEEKKEVRHKINFVGEFQDRQDMQEFVIDHQGPSRAIGRVIGGQFRSALRTITDYYREYDKPEYYLLRPDPRKKELKITIYRENEGTFEGIDYTIAGATKFLSFRKMDMNYDGSPDYFIRTVAIEDGTQLILYTILDKDLRPVFGHEHFVFRPAITVLNLPKASFLPVPTEKGLMAVPFFLGQGTIPEEQRDPDPWTEENLNKQIHLYYLFPNSKTGEVETRIVDDYKFMRKLDQKLNRQWYENINFVQLAPQSKSEFSQGLIRLHISHGVGFQRRPNEIVINGRLNWELNELDTKGQFIDGSFLMPVAVINQTHDYYETFSYVGLQTDTLTQYLTFDPKNKNQASRSFRYEHAEKRDHILGVMAGFQKNDNYYAFYQTKGNLVLQTLDGQGEQGSVATYPVNRVSFVPGNVFNEMFYPVVWGKDSNAMPGFYVDATQLNAGHIYVVRAKAESNGTSSLISPMRNNIFIPSQCQPLNPVRMGKTEAFSLVCQEKVGRAIKFVLRFLPID